MDDFLVLDMRKKDAPVAYCNRRSFWGTAHWSEEDLYPVASGFAALLLSLHAD